MTAGAAVGPLHTTERRSGTVEVLAIALAMAALHLLTNGRYGFHRDELQVLSDARHLSWGFVAVPPFTPAIERLGLAIFAASKGRFYYISPAYPMLIARGAVACAAWTARLRPVWRRTIWVSPSAASCCRLAGHNANSQGVRNEESQHHPDIFVCSGLKMPLSAIWKKYRSFG